MEIQGPKVYRRCLSKEHWSDMILFGRCVKCWHSISKFEEDPFKNVDLDDDQMQQFHDEHYS